MTTKRIRVVFLSIFNHTELYDEFYKENMAYLDALTSKRSDFMRNHVRFYYVKADPSIVAPVLNETERMITVGGTESWCPGILEKTLACFQFMESFQFEDGFTFDYVVRTNVSTFIDVETAYNELAQVESAYGESAPDVSTRHPYIAMGDVSVLQSMNHRFGLNENTIQLYQNERFFQGVYIVINRRMFQEIVRRAATSINRNIVDDVELGHFIFSYKNEARSDKNKLHVVNLRERMVSYYMSPENAKRPFVFCNNLFKGCRDTDLRNFQHIARKYVNGLLVYS
jgi:hypothetical protein